MVKNQISLLKNRRFLFAVFCILMFTFIWMYYQETKNIQKNQGACIRWASQTDTPTEALQEYYFKLSNPASNTIIRFSDSLYDEILLVSDTLAYFENISDYKTSMRKILDNKKSYSNFVKLSEYEVHKNEIEINCYEQIIDKISVHPDNYIAYEKFFTFGACDIAFLIITYLVCYFMIVVEREKGIGKLVYATKRGGIPYFFQKLSVLCIVMGFFSVVLNLIKLLLFLEIYKSADPNVSVQSMAGYFSAPWNISIREYIYLFFAWKLLWGCVISLVIGVICSLRISEIGTAVITFVVFVGNLFLLRMIPGESSLVLLRDGSLLGCFSMDYWIKALRIYYLANLNGRVLLIKQIGLPVISFLFYSIVFVLLGGLIYSKGLKASEFQIKAKNKKHGYSYCDGIFKNEVFRILFTKKALFILVFLWILFGRCICNYQKKQSENVQLEKQIVSLLNAKSFSDAKGWIFEKETELSAYLDTLYEMELSVSEGKITENEYRQYSQFVNTQMRIRPVLEKMKKQADEMEVYRGLHPNSDIKFEYTGLSNMLFSREGFSEKSWISLFLSFFLVFSIMTNLPEEKENGVYPLLCSLPKTKKSITYRNLVFMISIFLLSLGLYVIWLVSLEKRYGLIGFLTPAESFLALREQTFMTTVGGAVFFEIVMQSFLWVLFGETALWLSTLCSQPVLAECLGIGLFVIPSVIGIWGGSFALRLPQMKAILFGGHQIASSYTTFGIFVVIAILIVFITEKGSYRWSRRKTG